MRRATYGPARRRRSTLAIVAVLLAACSSGDAPGASDPTTTDSGDTTPRTTAPAQLTAADLADIRAAFTTFFGGATSTLDAKVAALEHGEIYRTTLADASENEQFQQLSTDIRDIVPGQPEQCAALGAPLGCAVVTHDLLVAGMPMAVAIESAAVRTDSTWLVGARAWCNVVEMGGATCPEDSSS